MGDAPKELDIADETRAVRLSDLDQRTSGPAGHIRVDLLPRGLTAHVEFIEGPLKGSSYKIEKPLVIIGRVEDVADFVLADDSVSRHHAAIGYKGGNFILYDLGSTNGTYINEELVTEAVIHEGTVVRVGDLSKFVFKIVQDAPNR